MGMAFGVLWQAFKDYYEEMFTLVGANLLWLVMMGAAFGLGYGASILLPESMAYYVGLLALALLAPPATAGMFYLTNQVAHHKSIEFSLFFEGVRKYLWKSYLLLLLNLLAALALGVNIWFYGWGPLAGRQWSAIAQGIFVGVAVMWCLIQIYVFPMLLEQQEPRLIMALRNAAFLTFASPITTLTLAVLMLVVAALSIGLTLPFAVAMMAVLCLVANGAVLRLLVHFGIRKPPEEAPAAGGKG